MREPKIMGLWVGMNKTGGPSSYAKLQSCLEIIRDAKVILTMRSLIPLLSKKVNHTTDTGEIIGSDVVTWSFRRAARVRTRHDRRGVEAHHGTRRPSNCVTTLRAVWRRRSVGRSSTGRR
jgi:hypothetical protein